MLHEPETRVPFLEGFLNIPKMLWGYVEKLVELDRLVRANHPQSPRTRRGVSGAQASMGRAGTLSPRQQRNRATVACRTRRAPGVGKPYIVRSAGRAQSLALPVAGIWRVQLIVSPLWLRHHRFGPAEWLWRSLTYGTR